MQEGIGRYKASMYCANWAAGWGSEFISMTCPWWVVTQSSDTGVRVGGAGAMARLGRFACEPSVGGLV